MFEFASKAKHYVTKLCRLVFVVVYMSADRCEFFWAYSYVSRGRLFLLDCSLRNFNSYTFFVRDKLMASSIWLCAIWKISGIGANVFLGFVLAYFGLRDWSAWSENVVHWSEIWVI